MIALTNPRTAWFAFSQAAAAAYAATLLAASCGLWDEAAKAGDSSEAIVTIYSQHTPCGRWSV